MRSSQGWSSRKSLQTNAALFAARGVQWESPGLPHTPVLGIRNPAAREPDLYYNYAQAGLCTAAADTSDATNNRPAKRTMSESHSTMASVNGPIGAGVVCSCCRRTGENGPNAGDEAARAASARYALAAETSRAAAAGVGIAAAACSQKAAAAGRQRAMCSSCAAKLDIA